MIPQTNNSPAFKAIFKLDGTYKEKDNFEKFIKKEVADTDSSCLVRVYGHYGSAIALTSTDAMEVENPADLPEHLEKSRSEIFDAEEFYDKKNNMLLPGIIYFDPLCGQFNKIISRPEDNVTAYYNQKCEYPKKYEERKLCKMDFNESMRLTDALESEKLDLLEYPPQGFYYKKELFSHVIKQNNKLKDIEVNGLAGAGDLSIVFNIDDKTILKLSESPCYPTEIEPFDLPVIDKGHLQADGETIYYCIQPKAQNSNEVRITEKEVQQIKDQVEKIKDETGKTKYKIFEPEFDETQIVIYKGKPYLTDYDCVEFSNGKSRMFSANEE